MSIARTQTLSYKPCLNTSKARVPSSTAKAPQFASPLLLFKGYLTTQENTAAQLKILMDVLRECKLDSSVSGYGAHRFQYLGDTIWAIQLNFPNQTEKETFLAQSKELNLLSRGPKVNQNIYTKAINTWQFQNTLVALMADR